jgi:predicted enzyme related to lactoylglutathione lyase
MFVQLSFGYVVQKHRMRHLTRPEHTGRAFCMFSIAYAPQSVFSADTRRSRMYEYSSYVLCLGQRVIEGGIVVNSIVHFELQVTNPEQTIEFYRNVFGWTIEKYGDLGYWFVTTGEEGAGITGGILPTPDGQARVINTIEVDSVDAYLVKINENGGKTIYPKMPIPGRGYVAYCEGPDGLIFGIFQRDEDAK